VHSAEWLDDLSKALEEGSGLNLNFGTIRLDILTKTTENSAGLIAVSIV
jgi:hypothetical protein